jgi:hypothetical protein
LLPLFPNLKLSKMKILIPFFSLLFFITCSLTSAGQSQVRIGAAEANEIFNDVKFDPIDGGTIQVGRTGTAPNTNIWLVKLNAQNQVVWQNTIANNGEDVISKVKICANGDYLVCGWFTVNTAIRGFAARISRTNGNFIWMRTTGTNPSFGERFYDVIETAQGNIALVGSYNFNPAIPANAMGLFVLLNSTGAELGLSRIRNGNGGGNGQGEFFSITQLPNGNLLIGGHYWVNGTNYNVILTEVNEVNTISVAQNNYAFTTPALPWNNNLNTLWQGNAFTIGGNVILEMYASDGCCGNAGGGAQVIYNYNLANRQLNGNLYFFNNALSSMTTFPIAANDIIITQSTPAGGGVNNFVSRIVNNVPVFTRQIVNPVSNIFASAVNNGNLALSGATSGAPFDGYAFLNTVNVSISGNPCVIQNANAVNMRATNLTPVNDVVPFINRAVMAAFTPTTQNANLPLANMCPLPCPPDTSTTVTKCANVAINLSARNGTTYSWTPATGLSSTTIQNPVCFATSTTQYTVTVFNAATNCTNNDIVNVIVNDIPVSNLRDTSICNGDTIQLHATGGTSYSWTPNYHINNTTIADPLVWPAVTTDYIVTITNANGCSINDTIRVTVNECGCEDSCNWSLTGNTNVKLPYFIGSKNNADFKIRTNNTQRMVVSAAGNVGINTPAPAKLLEVNGEARIGMLPSSVANERIVFANSAGDLHSLAPTGNTNQYLSGDGSWQNIGGGGIYNADQGVTLNGNTFVLGDVCNAGGGQFADNREINMNDLNLYFNSSKIGKLYMGINESGDKDCKLLYSRLEISSAGLRATNDYSSPLPSTSGLRFTDLTANDKPVENKYNAVLSLDEDGDVIWVNACCNTGKDEALLTKIMERLTKLENEVKESKAQAAILKDQLAQMDVVLSKTNTIVLNQNVPNPFSESTVITYSIPKAFGKAQIIFRTITGEVIKTADIKNAGKGQVNVFASDISSGIYTYTLVVDGKQVETKKMIKQ